MENQPPTPPIATPPKLKMSKKKKWLLIGAGIAIVLIIGGIAASSDKKATTTKPAAKPTATPAAVTTPKQDAGKVVIEADGTADSEAYVGGDVTWTITVKNTGTKAAANVEANTNFGGLQLVSIDPPPTEQPIEMIQDFGPLQAGASVTITYHLLATKVGVAKGLLSFYEKGKDSSDKVLTPQTIVR